MMRNIWLVARREFLHICGLKSFWLSLLILPVALSLTPLVGKYLHDSDTTHVVVVDRSPSGAGAMLQAHIADADDLQLLRDLSRYVQRFGLERADPGAPWAQHGRWYTAADIAAFRSGGGLAAALAKIDRIKPPEIRTFDRSVPGYAFNPVPRALAEAQGEAFGRQARALFDAKGDEAPEMVLLIGKDYPADPHVTLYAENQPKAGFVEMLQDVFAADLRLRLLAREGVTGPAAQAVQAAAPLIAISTPPPGDGAKESMMVRSIVPLALTYILMMSLMLSAGWMLQGSVEERSNKLLESLLACIRPEELMYGKLFGALAVGLLMIGVWGGCALAATYLAQGYVADMIRPALAPLSSAGAALTVLYFFLAGYIVISILFIAIGAMVDSMSDAQGYLTPVLLGVLMPISFLLQAILAGKLGLMVEVITWFPLWTPFAVLARLGVGMETWQVLAAAVLMAITIAVEIVLVGRLFRASLLASGQKPGLKTILERLSRSPDPR